MVRVLRWVLRTTLFVLGGAALMVLVGKGYALTQVTCTTICNPAVSAPLGAAAGFLVALMLPSFQWRPLD